jgi:SAM-dependent methyltransferase
LTVRTDPENVELEAAERYVSFEGMDILEIGCGEGRFTAKYIDNAKSIVAIDADPRSIRAASAKLSTNLRRKIRLYTGDAEDLELEKSESFDITIFSWSLCCINDPLKSLREAHRVLRSKGKLLNIMPDAVPTFETAMIQKLGGKDAIYEGSLNGFRAFVDSVRHGLFVPLEEQRVLFRTYFDDIADFIEWLPSKLGPFTKDEFESLSKNSLEAIENYVRTYLIRDGGFLVKDALIVSKSSKLE